MTLTGISPFYLMSGYQVMLLTWRKFKVFIDLVWESSALAVPATHRGAGRNQQIRQQLISVSVLATFSHIVPSNHVKDAVRLF